MLRSHILPVNDLTVARRERSEHCFGMQVRVKAMKNLSHRWRIRKLYIDLEWDDEHLIHKMLNDENMDKVPTKRR